ncbi:MAG: DUF1566 domain-containing protein [Spiribacter salinus]|uniref:DUF1566 domain-containing protein n=1 Tax=Spiribacter salinus TaxID=1335746 RepID=A0A540VPJ5_9GAMM|nr:MAG: DUF1566 domain-containing protein [Spiribacter salinus]
MNAVRTTSGLSLLTAALLLASAAWAEIPSATDDCESDLVETTPSSEFTPLEGGAVVRHERTGLEWRRCPEGMDWTGSGCSGTALTRTWQGALQYADDVDGWRLPDINELRSIVERCRRSPSINQQVFPDTSPSAFWSASPSAGLSARAWNAYFNGGYDGRRSRSSSSRVRLVRGGQ